MARTISSTSALGTKLLIAAALLIIPVLATQASAQTLGYAAQPQAEPFDSDNSAFEPPAADNDVPDRLRRAIVAYDSREAPGTIVIDTVNTALYYVLGQGRAIRYGVGVGREGFTWSGVQTVTRKAEWPDWHPPAEMIARQPYLPRFMAGGPGNPLGARAMYLGNSVYRIHGTNDPSTIGKFVSSGCIRLTNADVEDLFSRVEVGTRVVVLPKSAPRRFEARGSEAPRQVSLTPARSSADQQALNPSNSSIY
ncbi:MAG: L,D-transpeptidase [Rhodopseudomonas sp.]|uniref:L,D-transpeptidase n=1 Tax=Rhodopseudomonas sp. TaxID=1078 RepID=UPI0017B8BF7E|nr:L,D-transpeptidase [Rhodopseudomonas sp.]NVN88022.1 L,D-transpeptidase [Rhodopseudomonas sp.]